MAKKCPPGVICVENATILFIIIAIASVLIYYYVVYQKNVGSKRESQPTVVIREESNPFFSRGVGNVLLNPLTPPLRDGGYFRPPPVVGDPRGVPINIRTRGFDRRYRQVGLLTRLGGKETILPLMGRPVHFNRNKWMFYTLSDKFNSVKLPISSNGRSCTSEYGCDDLSNGDTVYVEGYKDAFKVTMYDNMLPRYIPFI
jgi:hypothetical protein